MNKFTVSDAVDTLPVEAAVEVYEEWQVKKTIKFNINLMCLVISHLK